MHTTAAKPWEMRIKPVGHRLPLTSRHRVRAPAPTHQACIHAWPHHAPAHHAACRRAMLELWATCSQSSSQPAHARVQEQQQQHTSAVLCVVGGTRQMSDVQHSLPLRCSSGKPAAAAAAAAFGRALRTLHLPSCEPLLL
jgi:hypothetical protein